MYGKSYTGFAGIIAGSIMILAASCSGGNGMAEVPSPQDSAPVIGEALTMEGAPSLEKISSGWQQWGDFELGWLDLHQSVHDGSNELDETRIFAKSEGVYNFEDGGKDYINFPAAGVGMHYAVFGLKDIPVGSIIRGIRFTTDFNSSESDDAEYYVAYSNYETGVFQWYGPYAEGDIELYNLFTNNVSVGQKAYFTIAVTGNNYYSDVTDVEVSIGKPLKVDLPLLYERQPIPNDWVLNEYGKVDWDLLWKRPEFQEIMIIVRPILIF